MTMKTDTRYVLVIPFDTKEQMDNYYLDARKSFYNNRSEVDPIMMTARIRKATFTEVSPLSWAYWRGMFPLTRLITKRID